MADFLLRDAANDQLLGMYDHEQAIIDTINRRRRRLGLRLVRYINDEERNNLTKKEHIMDLLKTCPKSKLVGLILYVCCSVAIALAIIEYYQMDQFESVAVITVENEHTTSTMYEFEQMKESIDIIKADIKMLVILNIVMLIYSVVVAIEYLLK